MGLYCNSVTYCNAYAVLLLGCNLIIFSARVSTNVGAVDVAVSGQGDVVSASAGSRALVAGTPISMTPSVPRKKHKLKKKHKRMCLHCYYLYHHRSTQT